MSKLSILVLLFLLAYSQAFSQQADVVANQWLERLDVASAPQLRAAMLEEGRTPWPHLSSDELEDGSGRDLVLLLRDRVVTLAVTIPAAPVNREVQIASLIDIANVVRGSGGYANLVLSDLAYRLSIVRLAEMVISGERSAVSGLLKRYPQILLRPTILAAMFEEEGVVSSLELPAGTTQEQLDYLWRQAGTDIGRAVIVSGTDIGSTSALLETPSAELAAGRMVGTKALLSVNLAGLVRYLDLGATVAGLPDAQADVGSFYRLLGAEAYEFSCPELGIRRLSPGHLLAFVEQLQSGVLEREALE